MNSRRRVNDADIPSQNSFDRIPIEIWRLVLYLAYPPQHAARFSDPNELFWDARTLVPATAARKNQFHRAQLRLVCKRLEPLGLELLFIEPTIWMTDEALSSLSTTAMVQNSNSSPPGLATRGLIIEFRTHQSSDAKEGGRKWLDRIPEIFPNVTTLVLRCHHMVRPSTGPHPTLSDISWIHGFKHIFWNAWEGMVEDMSQILVQNPDLESFVTGYSRKPSSYNPPSVNLSRLKRLDNAVADGNGLLPYLPIDLQWLGVTLTIQNASLCAQFLPLQLTHLHIVWSAGWSSPLDMDVVLGIVYSCPRLHTLSTGYYSTWTDLRKEYREHPSLKKLTIFTTREATFDMLRQWGFDSYIWRFPRFQQVHIRLWVPVGTPEELNKLHADVIDRRRSDGPFAGTVFSFQWG